MGREWVLFLGTGLELWWLVALASLDSLAHFPRRWLGEAADDPVCKNGVLMSLFSILVHFLALPYRLARSEWTVPLQRTGTVLGTGFSSQ